MELIETSTFTKQITALLSDEEYGEFQSRIASNPAVGALIKGAAEYARFVWLLDHAAKAAEPGSSIIGRCERT